MVDERGQSDHNHDGCRDRQDRFACDGQSFGDMPIREIQDVREISGRRAEDQQRHVLEEIADTDGGDQYRQRRCVSERLVCDFFDGHAQHCADDDSTDDSHTCRCVHRRNCGKDDETTDHDDVTMREVQHLRDTVYHRISKCDQRINAAEADAADQVRQKIHKITSYVCSYIAEAGTCILPVPFHLSSLKAWSKSIACVCLCPVMSLVSSDVPQIRLPCKYRL